MTSLGVEAPKPITLTLNLKQQTEHVVLQIVQSIEMIEQLVDRYLILRQSPPSQVVTRWRETSLVDEKFGKHAGTRKVSRLTSSPDAGDRRSRKQHRPSEVALVIELVGEGTRHCKGWRP